MKNKILDNISFGIIVITLLLIVFYQNNGVAMLYIGAIGLVLYGVVASIQLNKYGTISLGCGTSLLVTMILYTMKVLDKVDSITFMVVTSMMVISLLSLIFMVLNDKKAFKRYSLIVEGEVVDLERNPNTKKDYYRPIYAYVVDDYEYEVAFPNYLTKRIPNVGDKTKIYVDPQDHGEVYFEKTLSDKIKLWGTGIGLFVISLIILITLFI